MPRSWDEIRHNAIRFSREWMGETREEAEAKSFWDEFFQVFRIRRRLVATFEEPVKKITGDYGYIDLFWPGVLIVEHKSLGKAESQAFRYLRIWRAFLPDLFRLMRRQTGFVGCNRMEELERVSGGSIPIL